MYLIHRMSHERTRAEELYKENNLISYGWSGLSEVHRNLLLEEAEQGNKESFKNLFIEIGEELNNQWMTARRSYYLYNFLALRVGDVVILPKYNNVSICKVSGNPQLHDVEAGIDIGFTVPVTSIAEDIPRYEYLPPSIISKLKYQGSNLIINEDEEGKIDEVIENFKNLNPVYNFGSIKEDIVTKVHNYITSSLNPDHFEKLIKAYFENIEADLVEIPSRNIKNNNNEKEADIDIKAAFNRIGVTIYVQAKRHENTSDDYGIKQLIAYKEDNDDRFNIYQSVKWFITTGEVNEMTLNLAQENNIRVIQQKQFAELLVETGFTFSDEVFKKSK